MRKTNRIHYVRFLGGLYFHFVVLKISAKRNFSLGHCKPENVMGGYSVAGFYTFTKPYQGNNYVVSMNGSVNYNNDPILVNNKRVNSTNWFPFQELLFTYNKKSLEFNAGGKYCLSTSRSLINQPITINVGTWLLSHDLRMNIRGNCY